MDLGDDPQTCAACIEAAATPGHGTLGKLARNPCLSRPRDVKSFTLNIFGWFQVTAIWAIPLDDKGKIPSSQAVETLIPKKELRRVESCSFRAQNSIHKGFAQALILERT